MASSLSFSELAALYANKSKAPVPLFEYKGKIGGAATLPGATTNEKISKLFETRQNGLPPTRPSSWSSDRDQTCVAVCLVIVDTLHHEDIWREWMEATPRSASHGRQGEDSANDRIQYSAELFIHAKYPERVQSEWVKSHLIDVTFNPQWNSVEVVQAMLSTLDTALRSTAFCGRFLFGTESCLPLLPPQRLGEEVYAQECSWLSAYHTPVDKYDAAAAFAAVNSEIVPTKAVWKSLPGWIMLTRKHAAEVVALVDLLGGWGQPAPLCSDTEEGNSGDTSCNNTNNTSDSTVNTSGRGVSRTGWYAGTQGVRWRGQPASAESATTRADCGAVSVVDSSGAASAGYTYCADKDSKYSTTRAAPPAGETVQEATTRSTECTSTATAAAPSTTAALPAQPPTPTPSALAVPVLPSAQASQVALLDAWATVHAPEEVFFPTVLALLGYLRDSDTTRSSTDSDAPQKVPEVRIAMVNFAEWARRGDAHPIQYDYIDAHLVHHMTATGALLGRKFAAGSISVGQWRAAVGIAGLQASNGGAGYGFREMGDDRGSADRKRGHDYSSSYDRHYSNSRGYSQYDAYRGSGDYRASYADQPRGRSNDNTRHGSSGSAHNNGGYSAHGSRSDYQGNRGDDKRRRY